MHVSVFIFISRNNKMERELLILYGSQTGTAQDLAERIGREALRYFIHFSRKNCFIK